MVERNAITEDERRSAPAPNRDGAPGPEDAAKPDGPTDLTKPSWRYILGKTAREFSDDQCTDLAAALT